MCLAKHVERYFCRLAHLMDTYNVYVSRGYPSDAHYQSQSHRYTLTELRWQAFKRCLHSTNTISVHDCDATHNKKTIQSSMTPPSPSLLTVQPPILWLGVVSSRTQAPLAGLLCRQLPKTMEHRGGFVASVCVNELD